MKLNRTSLYLTFSSQATNARFHMAKDFFILLECFKSLKLVSLFIVTTDSENEKFT
jgi:hypothetical protein